MSLTVEQWDVFEVAFDGPAAGNPFLEVELAATFYSDKFAIETVGFYDGDGVYRVRFMPPSLGNWRYRTTSNTIVLDGQEGEFSALAPSAHNHGPVQVAEKFHFAYLDGTPFRPFGTTCYAWAHQGEEEERRTLQSLREAPFNKLRMCVFPKHYKWNENEPEHYPFPLLANGSSTFEQNFGGYGAPPERSTWAFDFERFNPLFFQHCEARVKDLGQMGIEADLILFHPYDRWGFAQMSSVEDERYLRYVVARLGAYRNVWWSMANEYDLVFSKPLERWDHLFELLQACDPYQHLRSIHKLDEVLRP